MKAAAINRFVLDASVAVAWCFVDCRAAQTNHRGSGHVPPAADCRAIDLRDGRGYGTGIQADIGGGAPTWLVGIRRCISKPGIASGVAASYAGFRVAAFGKDGGSRAVSLIMVSRHIPS